MKKYLYTLLFMAVALFGATTLVSCGGDDDDDNNTPDTPKGNYATGFFAMSEEYFEYGTATLTIEYDGKQEVIKVDESKKVSANKEIAEQGGSVACREVRIPVFSFKSKPVKVYAKLELTEEGKKKIADNPGGKMSCFAYGLVLGECNSNGVYIKSIDISSEVEVIKGMSLEGFAKTLDRTNTILKKEIK